MSSPRKRCENCARWGSTDSVWGTCEYATRRSHVAKAQAECIDLGRDYGASLETRYDFGCMMWLSCRPSKTKEEAAHG